MAVPSDPTVTSVVTEGLEAGGRVAPVSTLITATINSRFQSVKTDIAALSGRHPSLLTEEYTKVTRGVREYGWPDAADEVNFAQIVTAPATGDWIGTAQAGSTTTITLSASLDISEDEMIGRRVFITGGSGAGQRGQVTAWNNTTKAATFSEALSVATSATSTYLVEGTVYPVWVNPSSNTAQTFLAGSYGFYAATMRGRKLVFEVPPAETCVLIWNYWAALDRLDEAGAVFVRHLRAHRSLWVQGVAVKTNQRFDEDRYRIELEVYNNMLAAYGGNACNIVQGNYND